eukprot:TRINITY_DN1187_c0_g1_i4.p1 TRINITY_DN1187_c0_g1~~TRINITY_DN1187_c0_g1_i4.p1  ORF type:complete len:263 (-),score=37.69 TRINITY_DN1187_c0_g1_i4:85-873(-)
MTKDHWTAEEHVLFLEGLKTYGKGRWREMMSLIPTRSSQQIRAHAYRYFKRKENKRKRNHSINDADLDDINQLTQRIEGISKKKHKKSSTSAHSSPEESSGEDSCQDSCQENDNQHSVSSPIRTSAPDLTVSSSTLPTAQFSSPRQSMSTSLSSATASLSSLADILTPYATSSPAQHVVLPPMTNCRTMMSSTVNFAHNCGTHSFYGFVPSFSNSMKCQNNSMTSQLPINLLKQLQQDNDHVNERVSLPPISSLLDFSCSSS